MGLAGTRGCWRLMLRSPPQLPECGDRLRRCTRCCRAQPASRRWLPLLTACTMAMRIVSFFTLAGVTLYGRRCEVLSQSAFAKKHALPSLSASAAVPLTV